MSMLDRYRKPGGFLQLLTLMETTVPSKQEKFFEMIRAEDPRWADALRAKMIDVQKVLSWKDETLSEIIGRSHDHNLAKLAFSLVPEQRERIERLISHAHQRKLDHIVSVSDPQPQEVAAAQIKLIETVRAMINEGKLRLDKIDASLIIEEKIEDKLGKYSVQESRDLQGANAGTTEISPAAAATLPKEAPSTGPSGLSDPERGELIALRRKLGELTKENASLRQEVLNLRSKLEQIRRIA